MCIAEIIGSASHPWRSGPGSCCHRGLTINRAPRAREPLTRCLLQRVLKAILRSFVFSTSREVSYACVRSEQQIAPAERACRFVPITSRDSHGTAATTRRYKDTSIRISLDPGGIIGIPARRRRGRGFAYGALPPRVGTSIPGTNTLFAAHRPNWSRCASSKMDKAPAPDHLDRDHQGARARRPARRSECRLGRLLDLMRGHA